MQQLIKEIKKQGADCGGFATLLRRYAGLPVDKLGGTMEWFNYLKKRVLLTKNYQIFYYLNQFSFQNILSPALH